MLSGAPALAVDANRIASNVQRLPRFNVVGDAANIPAAEPDRIARIGPQKTDKELRTRAWLETNCAHCHNRDGLAQGTGVFFDVFRPVDLHHGICKDGNTSGASAGGRKYVIKPGNHDRSIAWFRAHSTDVSAQMPPIARSVRHEEAVNETVGVLADWIDNVVDGEYEGVTEACLNPDP